MSAIGGKRKDRFRLSDGEELTLVHAERYVGLAPFSDAKCCLLVSREERSFGASTQFDNNIANLRNRLPYLLAPRCLVRSFDVQFLSGYGRATADGGASHAHKKGLGRSRALDQYRRGDQAICARVPATLLRRRRMEAPIAPKPISIIAQVPGSGTAEAIRPPNLSCLNAPMPRAGAPAETKVIEVIPSPSRTPN